MGIGICSGQSTTSTMVRGSMLLRFYVRRVRYGALQMGKDKKHC